MNNLRPHLHLSARKWRPNAVGVLALTVALTAACTSSQREPLPGPPSSDTGFASISDEPSEPAPTTTTTTTPAARVEAPRELVGSWSASTSSTGLLELTIDADGAFHHYNDKGMDDRGIVSVHGALIDFHYTDGHTNTFDWSVQGGTLVLDDIIYLRMSSTDATQALAGEWIGYDDIFETLVFDPTGGFTRRHEQDGSTSGSFTVSSDKVTITLSDGTSTTLTWSVADATLTLTDASGVARQYARLS